MRIPMKYFFLFTAFILFFTGCSHNNAFSKFKMTKEQELSISSLQSSKIKSGEKIDGVFSAIYLNEVYPDVFNQNEYFYIYLYLKNKEKMYNPNSLDETKLVVKLNGKTPIKVKELPKENQFSHLTSTKNEWNRYYIVAFKESGKQLSLVIENAKSSSATLNYKKDEQ